MSTTVFHFSTTSLIKLKEHVIADLKNAKHETTAWISTNDALCSLLWQRITLARFGPEASLVPDPPASSTLCVAVNGRSKLTPPLPSTYLGNVNLYATSKLALPHLLSNDRNLGAIAVLVRKAVTAIDDIKISRCSDFFDGDKDQE